MHYALHIAKAALEEDTDEVLANLVCLLRVKDRTIEDLKRELDEESTKDGKRQDEMQEKIKESEHDLAQSVVCVKNLTEGLRKRDMEIAFLKKQAKQDADMIKSLQEGLQRLDAAVQLSENERDVAVIMNKALHNIMDDAKEDYRILYEKVNELRDSNIALEEEVRELLNKGQQSYPVYSSCEACVENRKWPEGHLERGCCMYDLSGVD
jgi:uncharacterized protein (DUF3084 family)